MITPSPTRACRPAARLPRVAALLLALAFAGRAGAQTTETLSFASIADTYVDGATASVNYDTSAVLRIDASPVRIAYLRFAVTGVNGRPVLQARLRLGAAGTSLEAGGGGTVHLIGSGTWNESTVTYATRPPLDGPALATLGPVTTVGTVVEFPLDGAVAGDGLYNLALDSTATDGMDYTSAAASSGQKPTLILTVAAGPNPHVAILQPAAGAVFFVGDAITLQGTAVDPVDGNLGATIGWTSSLQGPLGTGAVLTRTLVEGTHALTADVIDAAGLTGTASITVTVRPPPAANTAPLVAVTAPIDGQTFDAGQPIVFTGMASDLEDGVLTARLTWTSDVDGTLGTGGSFTRTLSPGTHRITAQASDAGGLAGAATVTVAVRAPVTMEFAATADAYVDAGTPAGNFGTGPLLKADANTLRLGYLRFAVSGVAGTVARAVLRLQVDTGTTAPSDVGGLVHPITNHTWAESLVTFNTRPAIDGPVVATVGAVRAGQVVDFDVTSVVWGNGAYDFALENSSSDGAEYRSREGGPAPKLVLTLAGNAPVVSMTAPIDGAVVGLGAPVTCTATATDVEDGSLSAALAWTSSLDGPLGTGPSLTTSALRAGTHTLVAAVTDASGLRGEARTTLVVRILNTPPVVSIVAPADGGMIASGTPVTLAATAVDAETGDLAAGLVWTSSLEGVLGTGPVLAVTLHDGLHTLTASVLDAGGLRGQAGVRLQVGRPNVAPTVTIVTPAEGSIVTAGTLVTLAATAIDPESGDLSAGLSWTSDLDGPLGGGASVGTAALRVGTHTLTAAVTDAGGLVGRAARRLVVRAPNQAPVVTLTAPAAGTAVVAGVPVTLAATALDDADGTLSAGLAWRSSLQGPLGVGASISVLLAEGMHTITASATDADGLVGTAQQSLVVLPASTNTPPAVLIVTPRDGRTAAGSEAVSFVGVADDREDGLLTARLAWTDDRDGALGVGGAFTRGLSLGVHHVTASVADAGGLRTAVTVTITVQAPTSVTFPATQDLYVDANRPTRKYGTATTLIVQGAPGRQAFFRFAVQGVPANAIAQARLRVTVGSGTSDGSPSGGTVYAITNNTWSEALTTYATRPALDGPALASRGAVATSQVVEFDVTAAMKGNGTYNFALVSAATDSVRYRSREAATGKPQLVITLGAARVTLAGTFTSGYTNGSMPLDTTLDTRTATFYGSATNSYPLNLGGEAGACLVGGAVMGQYDRLATWDQMHTLNNAGVNFDNTQFLVDGLRVDNVTDGVRPQNGGAFAIRNVHLSYIRDDCVENDHLHAGLVDDSFFDGCYEAFSARPSPTIVAAGSNGAANVWRIENTLVRLQAMPGPDGASADGMGNAGFFKWHSWDDPTTSLSPKLALHNNVFMAERVGQAGAARMGIPPGQLVSCSNNVMVWLGPGDYPAPLPACFTVTKDRAVWDGAVADWLRRHPSVAP